METHEFGSRIVIVFFFRSEKCSSSPNTPLKTTIVQVDESDGVHGRERATASLCLILTAQASKLSLSASLGWAEEAQKHHARNSDGDAAIIEVLSYPLCFRSLRLVVVAVGQSSWWQWVCDRHDFFEASPPGYAVL